jgi:hypothetical protein
MFFTRQIIIKGEKMTHYIPSKYVPLPDQNRTPLTDAIDCYVSTQKLDNPYVGTEKDLAQWAQSKSLDFQELLNQFKVAPPTNYKIGEPFVQFRHVKIGEDTVVVYSELPTVAKSNIPQPFSRNLELVLSQ